MAARLNLTTKEGEAEGGGGEGEWVHGDREQPLFSPSNEVYWCYGWLH